jgi:Fe-S-cluster containining protein
VLNWTELDRGNTCNNAASDRRINLFDRLQHVRYEHSIVVASVYKRLSQSDRVEGLAFFQENQVKEI